MRAMVFSEPGRSLRETDFLAIAPKVPVRTTVQTLPLTAANEAVNRLRQGKLQGAAVLVPGLG